MERQNFEQRFRNAVYSLKNSGIHFKLGERNPEMESILEDYSTSTCALISAWNPSGSQLSREENLENQLQLLMDVKDYILMEIEGEGSDKSWKEQGYAILGIDRPRAEALARKHQQTAFLWGEYGKSGELVFP